MCGSLWRENFEKTRESKSKNEKLKVELGWMCRGNEGDDRYGRVNICSPLTL